MDKEGPASLTHQFHPHKASVSFEDCNQVALVKGGHVGPPYLLIPLSTYFPKRGVWGRPPTTQPHSWPAALGPSTSFAPNREIRLVTPL